jgi:hypothetical protein
MFDETEAGFFDGREFGAFVERAAPPVEVALVLAIALLLLIDLVFVAQRGKLRLHLALEIGAALLTLVAAGRAWFRRARLVARPRKIEPQPARTSDVNAPIDSSLWVAIQVAILEESLPPPRLPPPRITQIRMPPPPPAPPA